MSITFQLLNHWPQNKVYPVLYQFQYSPSCTIIQSTNKRGLDVCNFRCKNNYVFYTADATQNFLKTNFLCFSLLETPLYLQHSSKLESIYKWITFQDQQILLYGCFSHPTCMQPHTECSIYYVLARKTHHNDAQSYEW